MCTTNNRFKEPRLCMGTNTKYKLTNLTYIGKAKGTI